MQQLPQQQQRRLLQMQPSAVDTPAVAVVTEAAGPTSDFETFKGKKQAPSTKAAGIGTLVPRPGPAVGDGGGGAALIEKATPRPADPRGIPAVPLSKTEGATMSGTEVGGMGLTPAVPRKRRKNEAAALWEMQSSYQLQVGSW